MASLAERPAVPRPNSGSRITRGAGSSIVFGSFARGTWRPKYSRYAAAYSVTARASIGTRFVRRIWSGVAGPRWEISRTLLARANASDLGFEVVDITTGNPAVFAMWCRRAARIGPI